MGRALLRLAGGVASCECRRICGYSDKLRHGAGQLIGECSIPTLSSKPGWRIRGVFRVGCHSLVRLVGD